MIGAATSDICWGGGGAGWSFTLSNVIFSLQFFAQTLKTTFLTEKIVHTKFCVGLLQTRLYC